MKDFRQMVDTYVLDHEKHKKYLAFVLALSMMVTFAVPLSLMQPAESMTANREFLATPLAGAAGNETLHPVSCSDPNCTNSAHTYSEVDLLVGKNSELRGATIEETIRNANATYAIGIASQFCIFLDGDFTTTDADAEGRVAVSGNVDGRNWDTWYYEIGNGDWYTRVGLDVLLNDSGYAHVISNSSNFKHVNVSSGAAPNNHPNQSVQGQHYSDANGNRGEIFKLLQVGTNTEITGYNDSTDMDHFYRTDTFSVAEQFGTEENKKMLLQRSEKLSQNAADGQITFGEINGIKVAYLTYTGTDPNAESIFFNFTDDEWAEFVECTHVKYVNIPLLDEPRDVVNNDGTTSTWDTAYIVINVPGTDVHLANPETHNGQKFTSITPYGSTKETWVSRTGTDDNDWSKNNHPGVSSLLYNFYQAKELVIANNFQGTLLAPMAHVTDEYTLHYVDSNIAQWEKDNHRGHLSGALIAKSFNGATEFGYRPYTGPISILGSTSGYTIPVDKFKADTDEHLSGAAFKLTIYNEDNNVVTSWTSGNATEYVTIPTMIDFTGGVTYTDAPDEDPKNDLVQTRSYTVKEESAPEGYIGTEKTYTLTVMETINKDTLLPAEGGGTIPRDVAVEITITSDTGENLSLPTFTISDTYNEDTQTLRKITIDGKEFWLEIENQKVSAVGVPTDEMRPESYESLGTTTSTSIEHLTDVYSRVITETVMTDVTVTDANGDAVLDADSNPVTERVVATEAVNTEDENGNSVTVYSTVTQVVTETVAVTAEDGSTVTVEGGNIATTDVAVTEKWSETNGKTTEHVLSEETVYVIYTDVQVTSTVISPSQLTNKTEVILDGDDTHYYFDPNSLMLMPLPSNNLTFTNDYGLLFEKTDGTNRLTGAVIKLQYADDWNGAFEDVSADDWTWNSSNVTIDVRALAAKYPGKVFRFHEETPPVGYEPADDIYFWMDGTTLKWSSDTATWQTQDITEGYATITMEDQKIHGAKLMLYKSDADDADKNLTNTEFALYHESNESVPIKEGITIANGKDGFDFYEAFRNDPETAYIKNGYLVPGTYYLLETNAPAESGYGDNLNRKYYFTVKDDYSISVGKPDAILIQIQGKSDQPTKVYYICDASGKPMNGEGNTGSIANVKSITFQVQEQTKTLSNLNELNEQTHAGSTSHKKEFSSPQNLTKLEFQTTDWNKDIHIDSVVIETFDGKKYVYNGSGSGNTGSGNTGSGDSGTGDSGSGSTVTIPSDFPEVSDGDAKISISESSSYPGKIFYPCDESGNVMDQGSWNGNVGIENVTSIRLITNNPPKLYSNVAELNDKSYDTTDTIIYLNSAQNISKLEIQPKTWDDGIEVLAIAFTTSSGEKYIYRSTDSNTDTETPSAKPDLPEFDANDVTISLSGSSSYPGKIFYPCDESGDVMDQGSWNGNVGIENVTSIRLITNNPPKLYSNVAELNDKSYDTTDTTITLNSAQNISKLEIQPKTWDDGIVVYAIIITDSNRREYYYFDSSYQITSTLTLFNLAKTQKAEAAESAEESEKLEIREPVAENDRIILDIPNKYNSDFNVTVTKIWDVKGNTSKIPSELTLTLEQRIEGSNKWEPYNCTPTFEKTSDVEWTYRYKNLPVEDENGNKYYYRIQEKDVPPGYELSPTYSENVENGVCKDDTILSMSVTNTLETNSHKVTKTWEMPEGTTVDLPDSIRVTLQQKADGETTWSDFKTVTITPDNGKWEYTFEDLPAEGMSYRAFEESLSGWDAKHDWSSDDSTAITNTYKTGGLRVEKKWEGDSENNRPEKITVKLYRKVVAGGNGNNATVTPTEPTDADGKYDQTADYSRLLQYSLYFYDANMCGVNAEENSALSWRGDCHKEDEVQGGFHDAGDHVMFGLPQGYTASTLGWSYYEFKKSYDDLGQTEHYKKIMDEFCNFFVASTTLEGGEVTKFLYQKGNGDTDHASWNSPEKQNGRTTDEMYYTTDSASDIAAEYAAALAIHYLNFPNDPMAQTYLTYAKALYEFSIKHSSCLDSNSAIYSTKESRYFYESIGDEYKDDQAWAGVWLYLITKDSNYLNPYNSLMTGNVNWIHCWDNVSLGAACVYAEHIDSNHNWEKVTSYLNNINNAGYYYNGATKDSNGNYNYWFLQQWGSARYNTAMQLAALVATTYSTEDNIDYSDWCKDQMAYILCDDPAKKCFVVGFADNSPQYPHHRAASGVSSADSTDASAHVLVGALVGGPEGIDGTYHDKRNDYTCNEVALDYNAGLVGAAAGLYSVYGTGTLADSLDDFPANSGIEPTYLTASTQSLTLNTQQSEKANAIKGIANVGSEKVAKATNGWELLDTLSYPESHKSKPYSTPLQNVKYIEIEVNSSSTSYNGGLYFNQDWNNPISFDANAQHFITVELNTPMTVSDLQPQLWWNDAGASFKEIRLYAKLSEPQVTITVDKTKLRVNGGAKTVTLTATPSDNVTFTRSDGVPVTDHVITVNPTEVGELTITATRGSTSTTQKIEFVGDPFIEGENTMNVDDVKQLTLKNAIGTVTWALKEESDIVTISDTGEVTALKNGTVTVVATDSYDNKTVEFSITVDLFALDVDTSGMEEVDTLILRADSGWKGAFPDLPLTDEDGNAYVYYIEEVLDPTTDTLDTPNAVYVPIDYSGNGVQLEENAGDKTIIVTNKLKSSVESTGQMPSAGGEGTDWYYMAGAAMMLAGIAGYFVLKRRQRSRADA